MCRSCHYLPSLDHYHEFLEWPLLLAYSSGFILVVISKIEWSRGYQRRLVRVLFLDVASFCFKATDFVMMKRWKVESVHLQFGHVRSDFAVVQGRIAGRSLRNLTKKTCLLDVLFLLAHRNGTHREINSRTEFRFNRVGDGATTSRDGTGSFMKARWYDQDYTISAPARMFVLGLSIAPQHLRASCKVQDTSYSTAKATRITCAQALTRIRALFPSLIDWMDFWPHCQVDQICSERGLVGITSLFAYRQGDFARARKKLSGSVRCWFSCSLSRLRCFALEASAHRFWRSSGRMRRIRMVAVRVLTFVVSFLVLTF